MKVGLRIDVDTLHGTLEGVPRLCRLLKEEGIHATFFFSVGPDNMGRNLWRLLRPAFFKKMVRTKAGRLYGWDVISKGVFWPGPLIGKKAQDIIQAAYDFGHEAGLHAWDHYAWQNHLEKWNRIMLHKSLERGFEILEKIIGTPPVCSAVPAWKCNEQALIEKSKFPFIYNSDCRGKSIFYPVIGQHVLFQPQIPVTLPTYDEVVGRNGIGPENFNEYILSLAVPSGLNVLTAHAEVEGISCHDMFRRFLKSAKERGVSFVSLGSLLKEYNTFIKGRIAQNNVAGRDGLVAVQTEY